MPHDVIRCAHRLSKTQPNVHYPIHRQYDHRPPNSRYAKRLHLHDNHLPRQHPPPFHSLQNALPPSHLHPTRPHASRAHTPFKNQLVRKWGPAGSIAKGSKDWELMPDIDPLATENENPIIHKNTYDAFINTNLAAVLEEKGIERVVVCGVMTDCCCDTTARSAFNQGFETWLVKDACGTASKKQHEAGLNGFGYAFGEVLETEEVVKRLS
ncbi:MAG: hypothetical protein L6R38_008490 [Xanthoria sp. 2 TBL-2021]|nr:MAG: hypothetical protein L6R38_008490 [Xanthoria sp. 2 TBL-2021]